MEEISRIRIQRMPTCLIRIDNLPVAPDVGVRVRIGFVQDLRDQFFEKTKTWPTGTESATASTRLIQQTP
jgi:hypothetical protein